MWTSDGCENHPDLWRDRMPRPVAQDNKFSRGQALIWGGYPMTGAARLAARAAAVTSVMLGVSLTITGMVATSMTQLVIFSATAGCWPTAEPMPRSHMPWGQPRHQMSVEERVKDSKMSEDEARRQVRFYRMCAPAVTLIGVMLLSLAIFDMSR